MRVNTTKIVLHGFYGMDFLHQGMTMTVAQVHCCSMVDKFAIGYFGQKH